METFDPNFTAKGVKVEYHGRLLTRKEQTKKDVSLTAQGCKKANKNKVRWQVELGFENDHNIDATDKPGKSGYFVGIMPRKIDNETPIDLNDMNNIKL